MAVCTTCWLSQSDKLQMGFHFCVSAPLLQKQVIRPPGTCPKVDTTSELVRSTLSPLFHLLVCHCTCRKSRWRLSEDVSITAFAHHHRSDVNLATFKVIPQHKTYLLKWQLLGTHSEVNHLNRKVRLYVHLMDGNMITLHLNTTYEDVRNGVRILAKREVTLSGSWTSPHLLRSPKCLGIRRRSNN